MMDPIIYGSSESATKINQHAPLVGQSTLEYERPFGLLNGTEIHAYIRCHKAYIYIGSDFTWGLKNEKPMKELPNKLLFKKKLRQTEAKKLI